MIADQVKNQKSNSDLFEYKKVLYNIGRMRGPDYSLHYFHKMKDLMREVRKDVIYQKSEEMMTEAEK